MFLLISLFIANIFFLHMRRYVISVKSMQYIMTVSDLDWLKWKKIVNNQCLLGNLPPPQPPHTPPNPAQ